MQLSTAQEATKQTGNIAVITQNIRIYITYVFCSSVINTYFSYTFHWTKNITNHNSLTYTLVVFTNGIFVQWPWICAHRKSTCHKGPERTHKYYKYDPEIILQCWKPIMRCTYVHTYFPSNDNHRDRSHRSRRQSNCGSVPLCSLLQDNNAWIIYIHSIISVSINRDATLFHWLHTFPPEHCAYILVKDAIMDCFIWFRIELQYLSKFC